MSNNMRDKFVASNFDEVDMVLDTDTRFEEAIAAADAGEEDLVKAIIKDLKEQMCVHADENVNEMIADLINLENAIMFAKEEEEKNQSQPQ